MTIRFNQLVETICKAYDFEFLTIYKAIVNFVTVDLSAFYLDFAKDVVYIEEATYWNDDRCRLFYGIFG